MSTLCLYTDSTLIHTVSSPGDFLSFSKWRIGFLDISASKVRTGADRLWAPFQVMSHDCSAFFVVDFLHQFIEIHWFSLHHLLSSCQISEFPHLLLGCFWPAKVMPKKGCSSRGNPKSTCTSIGDIPRTSEQFGIPRSVFWVASRCLVVQKSCDFWLTDPNILLQFMKITTTQSLAGILIFHDLVVALGFNKENTLSLKEKKTPKDQKCEFSRSQLGAFITIRSMRFLASLESQCSGKSNWGPSARPGKTIGHPCDWVHLNFLRPCAYIHDLAGWLDVVWPSLNFKQMSAGWDVFLAVQAANLLVDSAYCPIAVHLRKETISTAKHPAVILTPWGPHPP